MKTKLVFVIQITVVIFADITSLYTSKKTVGDRMSMSQIGCGGASLPRTLSVTGVPPSGRNAAAATELDRSGRPRSSMTASLETDALFSYERESPVL
jgi:hypothetical protein